MFECIVLKNACIRLCVEVLIARENIASCVLECFEQQVVYILKILYFERFIFRTNSLPWIYLQQLKKSSDLKKITADEVVELVRLLQKAELLPPTQQHSNCNRQIKLKVTKRFNACKWICMPTSSCTGWESTVRTDSIFKNSRLSLSHLIEITF